MLIVNLSILFQSTSVQPSALVAEDWPAVLAFSLASITTLILATAALDRWLARVLAPNDWPKSRRPAMLTLPAGTDPNAEPRGRLIPMERLRRSSGGISQSVNTPVASRGRPQRR